MEIVRLWQECVCCFVQDCVVLAGGCYFGQGCELLAAM